MSQQNTGDVMGKILSIFDSKGPCIPSQISKEIGLGILFTSAYLSELTSEKKLKISTLRVGSSPVYFIPGQENLLENFSDELKGKEKEAFNLLKERKFLKDREQEPAIRVALRSIKDFAVMFERNGEMFWRYFKVDESEFNPVSKEPEKEEEKKEIIQEQKEEVIEERQEVKKVKAKPKKKISSKKASKNNNDKFFNKIKEFLSKKSIEIVSIEGMGKNDVALRIRDREIEKLLVAYNKRRLVEIDLLKAHKKAIELDLPYLVLGLGGVSKKIDDFINAVKNLESVGKLD